MLKRRIIAIIIIVIGAFLGVALYHSTLPGAGGFLGRRPFRLGLDLSGGTSLLYQADVSQLPPDQIDDSMAALRDVIERRVNLFGVGEPVVTTQTSSVSGQKVYRLSIDLPGVTDVTQAVAMIGQTPFLEFKIQSDTTSATVSSAGVVTADATPTFVSTGLTGKYLKSAALQFDNTGGATVNIQFDDAGSKLFQTITQDNIGKVLAIYLDGQIISAPVIREAITGGQANISGNFTPQDAKALVGRLNSGALPVPISRVSTETVGATLGANATHAGVKAAALGFLIVAIFLLLWYRLPGLVAILALGLYVIITLILYKLIPVTLTAAGIAGFIISIGMAVDANILIFERFREERARGRSTSDAMVEGFRRAWFSIRDANTASIIIAVILFWFGTSLIKGFALTFGLGVIISMISAITITRALLYAVPTMEGTRIGRFLFSSGTHLK